MQTQCTCMVWYYAYMLHTIYDTVCPIRRSSVVPALLLHVIRRVQHIVPLRCSSVGPTVHVIVYVPALFVLVPFLCVRVVCPLPLLTVSLDPYHLRPHLNRWVIRPLDQVCCWTCAATLRQLWAATRQPSLFQVSPVGPFLQDISCN